MPEPYVFAIAAGYGLHRLRPWTPPGSRRLHRLLGWPVLAAGIVLVVRAWAEASQVDLEDPARLVTSGPYAVSRNPMYVGWALIHVGVGAAGGSGWIVATAPAAAALMHGQILREERALEERFGEQFRRYRAAAPRYLPGMLSQEAGGSGRQADQ